MTDPARAGRQLRTLAEGGYAVVYITEALCASLKEEIDSTATGSCPPSSDSGAAGNTGLGMAQIKRFVEQAVGSDILSDNP